MCVSRVLIPGSNISLQYIERELFQVDSDMEGLEDFHDPVGTPTIQTQQVLNNNADQTQNPVQNPNQNLDPNTNPNPNPVPSPNSYNSYNSYYVQRIIPCLK